MKSLLFLALASPILGALTPATDYSRVASWSEWHHNSVPQVCLATTVPDPSARFDTWVYYQDTNLLITEVFKYGNSSWALGPLPPVAAFRNTPIAVTHWVDTSLGGNVTVLYYANTNQILTERRYINKAWQSERSLGVTVHIHATSPALAGSIAVTHTKGDILSVVYRSNVNTVSTCSYIFDPSSPSISCANPTSWTDALDGTAITAYVDEKGNPHYFYQQSTSLDTIENILDLSKGTWSQVTAFSNDNAGIQMAALFAELKPGAPFSPSMLVNDGGLIWWRLWNAICTPNGWCPATPEPAKPGSIGFALAASSCKAELRAYYLTSGGAIAELTFDDGWVPGSSNILQ